MGARDQILVQCPHCNVVKTTRFRLIGTVTTCRACLRHFTITEKSQLVGQAPSPRQLALAKLFEIDVPAGMTAGELAELIKQAIRRRQDSSFEMQM